MNHAIIKCKIDNLGIRCREILAEYASNRANTSWLWGSPGAIWGYEIADIISKEIEKIIPLIIESTNKSDLVLNDEFKKSLYLIIKNYMEEMSYVEMSKKMQPNKIEYYKLMLSLYFIKDIPCSSEMEKDFDVTFFYFLRQVFSELKILWIDNIFDLQKKINDLNN
jgi:hypothetical protein